MPKRRTSEQFISEAIVIHGTAYDYSDVVYEGINVPVSITCNTHSNKFIVTPKSHLKGKTRGVCPICLAHTKSSSRKLTTDEFIQKAQKIHGSVYGYSDVEYTSSSAKVTIQCQHHGLFDQIASNHLTGMGCAKCAGKHISTEDFIHRSNIVHNNKYTYASAQYVANNRPITITCPIHGDFEQVVNEHMNTGSGCQSCGGRMSRAEDRLANMVESLGVPVQRSVSGLISKGELDIVIPSHKLAIEYGGVYWHTERTGRGKNYHKNKTDWCEEKGIQLLTIFSDEWNRNSSLIETIITHKLGFSGQSIYARDTKVVELSTSNKRDFFDMTHIQGNGPSSINYGLQYKGDLIAAMGFINKNDGTFYLNRYSTSMHVVGGFTKLLAHFKRQNTDWSVITTFADRRWSDGHLYQVNGWDRISTLPPDYMYVPDNNTRQHKFNYRRRYLPQILKTFNPHLSEYENCTKNKVYRIWDCGKIKYQMRNIQ